MTTLRRRRFCVSILFSSHLLQQEPYSHTATMTTTITCARNLQIICGVPLSPTHFPRCSWQSCCLLWKTCENIQWVVWFGGIFGGWRDWCLPITSAEMFFTSHPSNCPPPLHFRLAEGTLEAPGSRDGITLNSCNFRNVMQLGFGIRYQVLIPNMNTDCCFNLINGQ